ncbi:MAG: hypothetical protein IJY16_00230, partial [Clostridia bacterium]|nr:hypothetical protein [Clostridia bacterium]
MYQGFQILIYRGGRAGAGGGHFCKSALIEGEEALFDKNRLLFPVAVFASRIANRVLLAFCDGCHSLALAASHTVGARARPLFFAPWGQKIHPHLRKNLQKRGWAIHSEWNR